MNGPMDLDAYIAAGTRLLGIPVRPEWQDGIRQHLEVSFALAGVVLDLALPDEADPAAVCSG